MIQQFWRVLFIIAIFSWQACSSGRQIQSASRKAADRDGLAAFVEDSLLTRPELVAGQVGICIYDPVKAAYVYNHQGDKYFIPASNTKLFSLYAGLKYLGDSLVGMRYLVTDTALLVIPSGDPTFLHPAYPSQPVIDLMRKTGKKIWLADDNWQDHAMGRGWAWDDYNDDYAAERSSFPIYMNMIRWIQDRPKGSSNDPFGGSPSIYSVPDVDWPVNFNPDTTRKSFFVQRSFNQNSFLVSEGKEEHKEQYTPFITDGLASAVMLLKDTAGNPAGVKHLGARFPGAQFPGGQLPAAQFPGWTVLHSRPVDSLFRPMMYNSDNFFAEQTLLMVGNEVLGSMNDARTIDYLEKGVLDSLPQKPNWVDGCGLSRNDLFTAQDFVWLLNKLQREFGLARMERLLPTGGTGTLSAYYHQDSTYIYAKTGSLSGVAALSGYLFTKSGHQLLFSVLVNNYTGSGTAVRRQIEKMIHLIRDKY
ncbi:MAG TPA: D-alanyl-D-alanine carboxypeptidase [Puia sp.]|jgi:D-alanyl-D-alanine carboxypeptidase/D-alanyl-D-alanine-endopeptidase (penicillin-binding protein 4)|nr:D-alanyl-D-alanine carboxypeptidase [Puia sp.]